METRANAFIVGLGSLFLIAGFILFVLWTNKSEWSKANSYYTIYFQGSVTGLVKGSVVNYQGVPVGIVKKIKLNLPDMNHVKVTIALKDNIRLKEGTVSSLELQGLTGAVSIRLKGGGELQAPFLKALPNQPYPVIPFEPSPFENFVTTAPEAMHKLSALLDQLSLFFDQKNKKHLSQILENTEKISMSLEESMAPFRDFLGQSQHTLKNFAQTSQEWQKVAQEARNMIQENRAHIKEFTGAALPELRDLVQKSRETVEAIHQTADQFSHGLLRFLKEQDGYTLEGAF